VRLGFLSPAFLAALVAIAIPIVLHLLRRHADPVLRFSAVRLMRRAPVEQARRRRLRELLLLALRIGALALLAFSFARPYLIEKGLAAASHLTIVGIDSSYSMATAAQQQRAQTLARAAIDGAPAGGSVAVVRFDEDVQVVLPPTTDRGAARSAAQGVQPRPRATRYGTALAAAADLAGSRPAKLVLVSDLQRFGLDETAGVSLPPNAELELRDVGGPAGNLGLSGLARAEGGIKATVASTWSEPRDVRVRLEIDGRLAAEKAVTVPSHGVADVAIAAQLPSRGVVHAAVVDVEGYAADNERYLVLDPLPRPRLLVVTSPVARADDAFYVERAIAAAEGEGGLAVDELTTDRLAAGAEQLNGYAAIVLLGGARLDRAGADALSAAVSHGTGLLVAAGPSLDLDRVAALLPGRLTGARRETPSPSLTFAPVDVRHAVFEAFGAGSGLLGSARFAQIVRLPAAAGHVLARFDNGAPALVEPAVGSGRMLVFASDLGNVWNDFALHPAFVPFVHGAVRYLAGTRPSSGEVRVGELPGPQGSQPGVAERRLPSGIQRVAVNVDPREADEARLAPAAFTAAVPRSNRPAQTPEAAEARAREREQSLWRYGLMLMLTALVIESTVGRRT
jgi:hypothetical protein